MKLYLLSMKTMAAVFFSILIIGFSACNKEKDYYSSTGIITGFDYTKCGCCFGWMINIDSTIYLLDSIPSSSNINLKETLLPLSVKLDWRIIPSECFRKRIIVERIWKE